MQKLDFIICSLPRMGMLYPPSAPAILKSILLTNNFTCSTKDFVADWFMTFKNHPEWTSIDSWGAVGPLKISEDVENVINKKTDKWAKELLNEKPTWIGLSIFSYESHKIGSLLSQKIKEINPAQKIFMGGAGITNVSEKYAEQLFEKGIIDAFITGEGEEAIIELANGNLDYPGINNKDYKQLTKKAIDVQPIPNFDDYQLSLYGKENLGVYKELSSFKEGAKNLHTLPITASRGCVRKCVFCDVPLLWPKFTHRGGELIAEEIISHNKKTRTRKFHFTDSLVNGSMKEFRIMIDKLAKYNYDTGENITWTGQFIFRPKGHHTKEDWKMIGQSGASVLEVGIEAGSDDIRFSMGKKFTNDDIEYEMQNVQANKIATFWLCIVGWPTETEKHFEEYKEFLIRFHPYVYNNSILNVELGGTPRIQPNTQLHKDKGRMGIEMIPSEGPQEDLLWWNKNNPTLTLSVRILRRFMLGKLARELGYIVSGNEKDVRYLWSKWNELKDIESKWLNERRN